MATKLESYNFPDPATRHRGGGKAKYPWDEWLDGSIWELVRGKDFKGVPTDFRSTVLTNAKRHGGDLRSDLRNADGKQMLIIQFIPGERR